MVICWGKFNQFMLNGRKKKLFLRVFQDEFCIDESKVPFCGYHPSNIFIPGKPISFGLKILIISSSNGYTYKMIIYARKQLKQTAPLGTMILNNLLSVLNILQLKLLFDNFFTTYGLMKYFAS